MFRTVLHKHTLENSRCCVIHTGVGLPTNNALILSISWQQTHSLAIGIGWQWPHMHLIGREKFQTCKTLNFVTILIFTYQIRCSMPIWPSLSSVTSASLQVDVSRFTSRSGSKQYGRISPTGSNKETTDDASPSLTSAKDLKVLNHFQYPKKNWIYHFLPLCAH